MEVVARLSMNQESANFIKSYPSMVCDSAPGWDCPDMNYRCAVSRIPAFDIISQMNGHVRKRNSAPSSWERNDLMIIKMIIGIEMDQSFGNCDTLNYGGTSLKLPDAYEIR